MTTKKSTPVGEWQTSWFRFKLADGRVVVAPAHGAGGLFRGAHGEKQIRRAIRAAKAGEPTGYYEPKPGHMLVWPQYSFADNGPEMTIPLAGATVRLVKATRERTRAHKAGKAALGPDDWAAKPTSRQHATKKSPARLDREIAEVLSPFEGMRVVVTKIGAKRHGVRPGLTGKIKRVASADVRHGSPTSRARVLVSVHGTEFSTNWPTDALQIA